ncbi:MAG: hypothetical protein AAFV93_16410 [Chloroflexota bacterium]
MVDMAQNTVRTYTGHVGGQEIVIETGKLAMQAGGAVTIRVGETMLCCTGRDNAEHINVCFRVVGE